MKILTVAFMLLFNYLGTLPKLYHFWRDFFQVLNNAFYFIVCHFFAVGFSLVTYSSAIPHPTPHPNSPYKLNTCNEALQHMYRPYTLLKSVWLYLTPVSPV